MKFFKCPKPVINPKKGEKWGSGRLVKFPVSYTYNGGTIINGDWFDGYEVPLPDVPAGFKLVGIGIGLQLNSMPPYATQLLTKV